MRGVLAQLDEAAGRMVEALFDLAFEKDQRRKRARRPGERSDDFYRRVHAPRQRNNGGLNDQTLGLLVLCAVLFLGMVLGFGILSSGLEGGLILLFGFLSFFFGLGMLITIGILLLIASTFSHFK